MSYFPIQITFVVVFIEGANLVSGQALVFCPVGKLSAVTADPKVALTDFDDDT